MSCSGLLNDLKLFTSSASPSYIPSLPPPLPPTDAPRSPEMLLLMLMTDCTIRHGHPLIRPCHSECFSTTFLSLILSLSPTRSPINSSPSTTPLLLPPLVFCCLPLCSFFFPIAMAHNAVETVRPHRGDV